MSKVYEVIADDDGEYGTLCVFTRADTANQAKANWAGADELGNAEYIELRARRVPWADELEDIDQWSYPFMTELLKHGRTVWVGPDYQDFLDPEDLPMIVAYGGLKAFCDAMRVGHSDVYGETIDEARKAWRDGKKLLEVTKHDAD